MANQHRQALVIAFDPGRLEPCAVAMAVVKLPRTRVGFDPLRSPLLSACAVPASNPVTSTKVIGFLLAHHCGLYQSKALVRVLCRVAHRQ